MSHESEHRRMGPVLEMLRKLDIAINPAPEALYEAGDAGFQLWCTPDDHPEGWEGISMAQGAFANPVPLRSRDELALRLRRVGDLGLE